jgi:hypothetical protein
MTSCPRCSGLDASRPCDGWRNLSLTKHALLKGVEQLEWLHKNSGYHIADCPLSEHSACVYKARELSASILEELVCLK